jgi:hypothetical protein
MTLCSPRGSPEHGPRAFWVSAIPLSQSTSRCRALAARVNDPVLAAWFSRARTPRFLGVCNPPLSGCLQSPSVWMSAIPGLGVCNSQHCLGVCNSWVSPIPALSGCPQFLGVCNSLQFRHCLGVCNSGCPVLPGCLQFRHCLGVCNSGCLQFPAIPGVYNSFLTSPRSRRGAWPAPDPQPGRSELCRAGRSGRW